MAEQRRLAAILAADMVGYSRLMEADESGTIARQKAHRDELIDPKISEHNGRIVKTTGDGLLAEFASVVDAIKCAVEIQRAMPKREVDVSENHRIQYRVGINTGDIIIDGEDIFGDGVNVASRLEGIADPGGICIPRKVFDEIRNKLDVGFEFLGQRKVKNIETAIPVYKILLEPEASGTVLENNWKSPATWRRPVPLTVIGIITLIAVSALWWILQSPTQPTGSSPLNTTLLKNEQKVAVLPFQNISADPEQGYFADGLAEDLITDLSKVDGIPVVSRTSSFSYRNSSDTLAEIALELKVRYIIEGSVRRHGKTLRITAKLVDTKTDSQLWAERFDGSSADVFAFQDQITEKIVEALRVKLSPAEQKAITIRGTRNPVAHDAYLRGMQLLASPKLLDIESNFSARKAFEKAIEIDPDYALAYAGLAWSYWLYHSTINVYAGSERNAAFLNAEKSLKIRENALAHRTLAKKHFSVSNLVTTSGSPDLAAKQLQKAESIEPNDPDLLADYADVLPFAGNPKKALEKITKAIQLNPNHPNWYHRPQGVALFLNGDYRGAAREIRSLLATERVFKDYYLWGAAALALSGQVEQARKLVADYKWSSGHTAKTLFATRIRWPLPKEYEELFFKGLRLAGVPDGPLESQR